MQLTAAPIARSSSIKPGSMSPRRAYALALLVSLGIWAGLALLAGAVLG